LYTKLGTNFTQLMFESQMAKSGKETVLNHTPGVFEESKGAVIYKGEKDGLHTRVFLNSLGIPTYEAKDIGLALYKEGEISDKFGPFDVSILVTAEEQKEYYKVVLAALKKIKPEITEKTTHITHGMMRFSEGKMSSRLGNVITGESLLSSVSDMVEEKITDRGFSADEADLVKEVVSIGAIKYSILRQAIGKDIVFDPETSISFEGDSGPYIQYTYTRAKSVVDKAGEKKINFMEASQPENWEKTNLECLLYRLPETIKRSLSELSPQYLVTLLTAIAGEFNSFYGSQQILDGSESEAYKVALTKATMQVLQNGLKVLGIRVIDRM
jgi:arginyl-tRNA synthetase